MAAREEDREGMEEMALERDEREAEEAEEALEDAPRFERDKWNIIEDADWAEKNRRYFENERS